MHPNRGEKGGTFGGETLGGAPQKQPRGWGFPTKGGVSFNTTTGRTEERGKNIPLHKTTQPGESKRTHERGTRPAGERREKGDHQQRESTNHKTARGHASEGDGTPHTNKEGGGRR